MALLLWQLIKFVFRVGFILICVVLCFSYCAFVQYTAFPKVFSKEETRQTWEFIKHGGWF